MNRRFLAITGGLAALLGAGWLVYCSPYALSLGRLETPAETIWLAAIKGDTATVKLLLDRGVSVNARPWFAAGTPLIHAATLGRTDMVRLLLQRGADANARDGRGNTPLLLATLFGHHEVVALLLESGADPGLKNERGQTPLSRAKRRGDARTVALLKRAGAAA